MNACRICGGGELQPAFAAARAGVRYESRYCSGCRSYQTVGDVPAVSPDYVDLTDADLDAQHRFLQTDHKRPAFEQWAELLAPSPGQRLLEIGCGVGGFLDFAAAHGLLTYGFDASAAQSAEAALRHPAVATATGVADYSARIGTGIRFDYAVLWDVFEHVREPGRLLGELRDVMAPAGTLFLSVPSAAPIAAKLWLGKLAARPIADALIPWEHVFYHSPRSLATLCAASGWQLQRTGGVATYVRTPSLAEQVRRTAHRVLRDTPWAFQIFAIAQPCS